MAVRVRFAPSPTGPLHLGGVRTALYNYLFAKKNNGTFILRIEDTDQNRLVSGAEQYIMDSLAWCGITINEGIKEGGSFGPYRQSDRKSIYKQYADELINKGHAYYAFDSNDELDQLRKQNPNFAYNGITRLQLKNSLTLSNEEVQQRLVANEPYTVRIKVPQDETISFNDIVRGHVSFQSNLIDDKVMFKSDGMPTYHLANVVDDYLMQITHVIRGEEWLPSTPIHVLLYRFLGWEQRMPAFAHLPLILKPDGNGKLSKRDGDRLGFPVFPLNWTNPETQEQSEGFKERGFLPAAFVNFLALLGWNDGSEQELFDIANLAEKFDLYKLHKNGAKFDFEKAKWFNAEYIKLLSNTTIASWLKENQSDSYAKYDTKYLEHAISLIKERLVFLQDVQQFNYLFSNPENLDIVQLQKLTTIKEQFNLQEFKQCLVAVPEWTTITIEQELKNFAQHHAIKIGDLMKFLRISLVGNLSGPAIPDLIALLGVETTMDRINNCYTIYK